MTTPRMLLLLWSALSLFIKAVQTPEGRLGREWGARGHRGLSPSVWDSQGLPPVFEKLPLDHQSRDGWREKALSWLKIFQMMSNKRTAEKSHWLKKKTNRGGADSGPQI